MVCTGWLMMKGAVAMSAKKGVFSGLLSKPLLYSILGKPFAAKVSVYS
jgi:hypothetical protein